MLRVKILRIILINNEDPSLFDKLVKLENTTVLLKNKPSINGRIFMYLVNKYDKVRKSLKGYMGYISSVIQSIETEDKQLHKGAIVTIETIQGVIIFEVLDNEKEEARI